MRINFLIIPQFDINYLIGPNLILQKTKDKCLLNSKSTDAVNNFHTSGHKQKEEYR